MKYREIEKTGDKLSILGYGCMRYPRKNGQIDFDRTEKQIITAIDNGVNYFDTAYTYPGSEKTLGKLLAKNKGYREKIKIATKMPILSIKVREDMGKLLKKQLERLQTDYIDYYMIHGIITIEEWEEFKKLGILEFIQDEQKKRRIINFGFSFHGNLLNFKKIVDDYDWDFCMIQYNYIDEHYQAGTEGMKYASEKGLGVIAMEPIRGGMLVNNLPAEAKKYIDEFEPKRSPAEWALRWIWNHPEIQTVISGMNEEEHIQENIAAASDAEVNSLNFEENEMLNHVKQEFKDKIKVDCTSCAYCMPCPKGVDIPTCFSSYNDKAIFGGFRAQVMYVNATADKSAAYLCTECGVCEKKCPQEIAIIEELKNVSSQMDRWYYRLLGRLVKFIMYR